MPEAQSARWDVTACVLMLTVPLAFHFEYHDFDAFSVDGAVLLGTSAGLGLALGILASRSPPWLRVMVLAAITVLFLDLQFNPDRAIAIRWLVLGVTLLVWSLRRHFTEIATASLAAILATLPFRNSPPSVEVWKAANTEPTSSTSRLVPIVHIILDEHPSPNSFPADVPEAVHARDKILDFYRRHHFRLFERAYSRHFLTKYAIPETLSPPEAGRVSPAVQKERRFIVPDAKLFAWASGVGYRVHVLQSDYLDVCNPHLEWLASCRTYRTNSLRSLQLLLLDPVDRIGLEYLYFVTAESYLARKAIRLIRDVQARNGQLPHGIGMSATNRAEAGMVLREIQRLRDRIRGGLAGEYQFAHLMLPHFPYEVDASCRGHREIGKRLQPPWNLNERLEGTAASRRIDWALHAAQVECLYTYLDSLVATIDSVASAQGVLIVLHGDHGSRLTPMFLASGMAARMTDEIIVDGFATLLAIRGRGVSPGVDTTPMAVQGGVFGLITGDSLLLRQAMSPEPVVMLHASKRGEHVRIAAPVLGRGANGTRR